MLKKLLGIVLRPPLPQIVGLLLLTAVVWYGGRAARPWLGFADPTLVVLCVLVWVVAGLLFVWRRLQAARRAKLIEDRLRGQAREHREAVRPDRRQHLDALEKQLDGALAALKNSKLGKGALYQLPWYIVIGPPGSGKTTLLRESGLNFPQSEHGRGLRGIGGTRNCDWWFTDSGILLDTAGRYTTQTEDRDEWLAFLEMLKKARSKKPINGALIAIGIGDLVQATDEQLSEHARRIHARVAELTERLEMVFPVYLLFTKCDLLDGFVETFGAYGKKERGQTWGFTFPYLGARPESLGEAFRSGFDELQRRLQGERLALLGGIKSSAQKRKVWSFPMQFAAARERLAAFVQLLAQPNPYHESSELRGCYFTSGTQEGKPLDQLLRSMRDAAGLQVEGEEAAEGKVDKKSYFIDELFTQVVFPDQDLARSSTKAEQRRELLRRVGMIGAAAAALILSVLLVLSFVRHAGLIERSERVCREGAQFDPTVATQLAVEEGSGAQVGRPFEALRELFVELDREYGSVGSYVLGQVNPLYERCVRPLYVAKLRAALIEPIQQRLRESLAKAVAEKGQGRDVRDIADELTAYRMLGGELLLNRQWLAEDFLKRRGYWTWRPGQEVPACRPHRDAFLERVATAVFRDWQFLPEEAVVPAVNELVRGKDIYGRELQAVLEEQGQAGKVGWSKILSQSPQSGLLDEGAGVVAAYVNETPLDPLLEKKGDLLGGNSSETLKARWKQEAIDEWKSQLAKMGPRRKSNLEDAMKDVAQLTGEDSVYTAAYREVCNRLSGLGVECRVGDLAWLRETLKSIQDLRDVVQPLFEARPHLQRIVPEAKRGEASQLERVRQALAKARIGVRTKTEEYADAQLKEAMQRALLGLLDAVQFALAREIEEETNKVWREGIGKALEDFGRRFPCAADGAEVVDTDRFEAVFKKGGEFESARKWLRYLEETAQAVGFTELHPEFAGDLAYLDRVQAALCNAGAGEFGCDVEFLLQKVGNTTAARFQLGDEKVEAKQRETRRLRWRPTLGAAVEVVGFQVFQDKVGARIEELGKWGLLRLCSQGRVEPANFQGKDYTVFRWDSFKHPKTGQPLAVGETKAELALLVRTESGPNPVAPGFFTRRFATEVFRASSR